jgi:lipoate-protein ligase A
LKLYLWDDPEPRDGAWNMALDEALLRSVARPVLRLYRWCEKTVSLGCFGSLAEARETFGSPWALVRRWTGGGLVAHDGDWSYSLIVPVGEPLGQLSAASSYRVVHSALSVALRSSGIDPHLAADSPPFRSGLCFAASVPADVLIAGRKIAGAAQRRTRFGFLHQGSVQGITVPETAIGVLAEQLAGAAPTPFVSSYQLFTEAARLRSQKYATEAWLGRIP